MARVKHSIQSRARKKKVLKAAAGRRGDRSRRYRMAQEAENRALRYSTRDRKVRKREFRSLWIVRINAACREMDMTYSRFVSGLTKAGVAVDRKMIAEMAVNDMVAFKKLADIARG